MNLFKQEKEREFEAIGLRDQSKNVKVLDQVGKSNLSRDVRRKALAPGKRISSSGNVYWETRKNRSDQVGRKV